MKTIAGVPCLMDMLLRSNPKSHQAQRVFNRALFRTYIGPGPRCQKVTWGFLSSIVCVNTNKSSCWTRDFGYFYRESESTPIVCCDIYQRW
ncbi:hypothetical protein L1987_85754 [Smallanthus sonchifolius]|uniref:Uncharacterized protein n=1 Tax=Smallanthus sonchifolius TaxID=185202 RepID=A0ACB8XXU9_9ASTR|nr:hypothetical protein L1987_85754 [Smallanthus sonchifolius]